MPGFSTQLNRELDSCIVWSAHKAQKQIGSEKNFFQSKSGATLEQITRNSGHMMDYINVRPKADV